MTSDASNSSSRLGFWMMLVLTSLVSAYLVLRVAGEEPFVVFEPADLIHYVVFPTLCSTAWVATVVILVLPSTARNLVRDPLARIGIMVWALVVLTATMHVPYWYASDVQKFACVRPGRGQTSGTAIIAPAGKSNR